MGGSRALRRGCPLWAAYAAQDARVDGGNLRNACPGRRLRYRNFQRRLRRSSATAALSARGTAGSHMAHGDEERRSALQCERRALARLAEELDADPGPRP